MTASSPQFTLYTHHTCPAAFRVAHVLGILNLTYKPIYYIDSDPEEIQDRRRKKMVALNPNGRSPILIDHAQNDHVVWESGAILLYIVRLYDPSHSLYPSDVFAQSQVDEWLFLALTTQSPYMGQAFWFGYWHSEVDKQAYERYVNESKRVLAVVEVGLDGKEWLVGGKMSIADVSFLAWYEEAYLVDVDIAAGYPRVHAWLETMKKVPGIVKGSVGREMIEPPKLWER